MSKQIQPYVTPNDINYVIPRQWLIKIASCNPVIVKIGLIVNLMNISGTMFAYLTNAFRTSLDNIWKTS